jgi:hypothetical protein
MSTAAPGPKLKSIAVQILRGLALAGLAIGFGLVGGLLLLPRFSSLLPFFRSPSLPSLDLDLPVALAMFGLTPVAIFFAFRRVQPGSARGWVILGLITATVLVADLVLVAVFPGIGEGIEASLGVSFWRMHGLLVVMTAVTLFGLIAAVWQLQPFTVRRLVQCSLVVGALLTLDLVVAAFQPTLLEGLQRLPPLYEGDLADNAQRLGRIGLVIAVVGFVPFVLFFAAWRLRWHSWRWIGAGYLVLAPVFAYLAADDPVLRRPMTMDEIAPAFPGAEESFAVLMRYGNRHPLGRDFRQPQRMWRKAWDSAEVVDPSKPAGWQIFVVRRRDDIEADWAELAPVRAWWTELNAFDRIADLTPMRFDAETMVFSLFRAMSQRGCAIASLQALDGHGDAAVETLLPILEVSRKLQPSARTLVRPMIAIVMERMCLETANFVLDHAAVSPAARTRLVAVLSGGGDGAAGARRLIAIEYAAQLGVARDRPLGDLMFRVSSPWLRRGLNTVSPLVFNPRATFNLYGDFVAEEQELAANREFDQLAARTKTFLEHTARPHFKNFVGTLLLGVTTPILSAVAKSYWKAQDTRAALLARLTVPQT